jgi:hypothetical protein
MMRRRKFITGLGGAVAWPAVAGAQRPALPGEAPDGAAMVGIIPATASRRRP